MRRHYIDDVAIREDMVFWQFAEEWYTLARKKEARRALTPYETQRVLETIDRHPHGLFLTALYYLGLRRGETLGLKWGDFDWEEDLVHVQRDIDYTGSTAQDGDLKTDAADRYVPVPDELRALLVKARSLPDQYVFHNDKFETLSQNSSRHIWSSLMQDAGCVVERGITDETSQPTDILKRLKPILTPSTSGTTT